jgi:uncharacterized protein
VADSIADVAASVPLDAARPAQGSDRIELLDGLRGFALLGILLANMIAFSGWVFLPPDMQVARAGAVQAEVTGFLYYFLLDGKFYTVFSLLFGIGFAVQLQRLGDRGAPAVRVYTRRLLGLLFIGLIHLVFIWTGDILTLYAMAGFVLLLVRSWPTRALACSAVGLIFLPVPAYALWWLAGWNPPGHGVEQWAFRYAAWVSPSPPDLPMLEYMRQEGWPSYRDWVLASWPWRISGFLDSWRIPKVLGMFFLGACVGRELLAGRLFDDTHRLRRIFLLGLAAGLPANAVYAGLGGIHEIQADFSARGLAVTAVYAIGVVPLGLAYAAGLALLWQGGARWLRAFAPAGRMALTNYLMHSILAGLVFYGYGLGLAGYLPPWQWFLLALAIILGQIELSKRWLRRYRFGPMEWLWRCATYGKFMPIRIQQSEPGSA